MSEGKAWEPPVKFPIKPPGSLKVWKVVDIKKRGTDIPIRFIIQEVPEDRYEEVIEHMCTYFIADEPMCKCYDGVNDPEYVDSFRQFWKDCIRQGLAVAAFTENPDGGKPLLAGVNMLALSFKDEKFNLDYFKSKKGLEVLRVVGELSKRAQVFEKYGVDRYITAYGLSVHPSFRGAALGSHLLAARVDIGRTYNIAVTSTSFTSPISQKLAERCGYETLLEEEYKNILDKEGNLVFPGIQADAVKIMARRLD